MTIYTIITQNDEEKKAVIALITRFNTDHMVNEYDTDKNNTTDLNDSGPCIFPACNCEETCNQEDRGLHMSTEGYKSSGNTVTDTFDNADTYADDRHLFSLIQKEYPLPHWAQAHVNTDRIERMTNVITRDGKITGNGVIFDIEWSMLSNSTLFHVITDAGNIISLSLNQLKNQFHAPQYISRDFPNNQNGQVDDILAEWYRQRAS